MPTVSTLCGDLDSVTEGGGHGDIINYHDLHILNDGRATRLDESTGDLSHIHLTVVSNDIAHELERTVDADLHSSDHFPIQLNFSTPDHPPDVPHVFAG